MAGEDGDGKGHVRIEEIEGRGRAMVAAQPLRAGQIVLRDSPILLYSALPLTTAAQPPQQHYCSNCFRILQPSSPTVVSCSSCSSAAVATLFCNLHCRSVALASSHTPWVCTSLTRLRDCPWPHHHEDLQVQARFLVTAYNLAIVSPSNFQTLLSLQGMCTSTDEAALFLHSLVSSLCPPPPPPPLNQIFEFSLQLTASLLAKDKLNSFGLMEPFSEEDRGRSVRAYGIYPKASFFNHDCLPNACRFDYVDHGDAAAAATTQHGNTDIVIRVIHDVPQDREIFLSYFPVNLKYSERQRRLREDYIFTCDCDRCNVESNWEEFNDGGDNDNNEDEEDVEVSGMDEDRDEHMDIVDSVTEDGNGVVEDSDFPHAYFFVRYMCNRTNCWGTLAPLPPLGATPSLTLECNVCGDLKNFEEELIKGDDTLDQ